MQIAHQRTLPSHKPQLRYDECPLRRKQLAMSCYSQRKTTRDIQMFIHVLVREQGQSMPDELFRRSLGGEVRLSVGMSGLKGRESVQPFLDGRHDRIGREIDVESRQIEDK